MTTRTRQCSLDSPTWSQPHNPIPHPSATHFRPRIKITYGSVKVPEFHDYGKKRWKKYSPFLLIFKASEFKDFPILFIEARLRSLSSLYFICLCLVTGSFSTLMPLKQTSSFFMNPHNNSGPIIMIRELLEKSHCALPVWVFHCLLRSQTWVSLQVDSQFIMPHASFCIW